MPGMSFNRGLDQEFVDCLNEIYESGGWWRAFVDDEDLFLAIRDNYVDVYYRGCSILNLVWKPGIKTYSRRLHYKYLLRPELPPSHLYVEIVDGAPQFSRCWRDLFLEDVNNVDDLKKAATPYAGAEKTGVHDVVLKNKKNTAVLDVEIQFGGDGRLDIATLRETHHDIEIVFFEAKHFNNKKELRAAGTANPKVIGQINHYQDLLSENRDAVVESYRRVCGNLRDLRGLAKRHPERHEMLSRVADGTRELLVDENPRLVVFGFDADQRDGKHWARHCKTLIKELGEDRVLRAGRAEDITLR